MLANHRDTDGTSSLSTVFLAHRKGLIRFLQAIRRGVDAAEIEDTVQELWLRCRDIDTSNINDPKSYLYRMAQNLVLDRERRVTRGLTCEADWGYVNARVASSVEEATAERSLIARDALAKIDRILKKIGERPSWIFRRYRLDGVQQFVIAAELGVSLSTVEKDLRKAYQAILSAEKSSDEE